MTVGAGVSAPLAGCVDVARRPAAGGGRGEERGAREAVEPKQEEVAPQWMPLYDQLGKEMALAEVRTNQMEPCAWCMMSTTLFSF